MGMAILMTPERLQEIKEIHEWKSKESSVWELITALEEAWQTIETIKADLFELRNNIR